MNKCNISRSLRENKMADSKAEVGGRVERTCQPCLSKDIKRTADVFCSTCSEFQCTDCSNIHTVYSFMKNHKVVNVKENQSLLASMKTKKVNMNGLDICKIHYERFKFYCEDHEVLVCSTCAFAHHRKCDNVVEIENVAKEGLCDELRNELDTAVATTKESVENLKEAKSCLSFEVQEIPERLNKIKETFVKMFDDFAKNVTEDAVKYRDKTTTTWTEKLRECESHISDMAKSLDTIEDSISNGTASEQFIIERSMHDDVKKQTNKAVTVCTDLKVLNVACNFENRFEEFKASMMSTLTSNEFSFNYYVPRKTKLELITSIDLKQTGDDVDEPFYCGLDFLPDGRLVAVDNQNDKCLIYDENLNLQTIYKLPFDFPYSVVAVSNEDITITAGEQLEFLHISNTNEITLNKTSNVDALCDSISMLDDENFVVGCYDDYIPVRIISMSGEEKTFDIEFPSKEYSIGTSFCTYIRGQDKIVMSDTDEDTIYIYDIKTGEKILLKDDLIKEPCDVAVGPCDHVFVCSKDTNSIVEITTGGRVLSSHKTDVYDPRFLAVSKDRRRLAVSNATIGAKKLALYKLTSE